LVPCIYKEDNMNALEALWLVLAVLLVIVLCVI